MTMMTGRRPVASGSEVQYWGYSTSRYPRISHPQISTKYNRPKPQSCLRRFRAIFGRYLIVRYLGNRANQNIDQILPKKKQQNGPNYIPPDLRLGLFSDTRIAGKHFSFPSFFFCFVSAFLGYSILFPNKITDLPNSRIAGKITFPRM
jgi:hypothetical protein